METGEALRISLQYCIYCREEHVSTSYCSRSVLDRMGKGHRKSRATQDGESSESEDGSSSSGALSSSSSGEDSSGSDSDTASADDKVGPVDATALEEFYAAQKRPDAKDVTCVLHATTLNHYFKSIVGGRGETSGQVLSQSPAV